MDFLARVILRQGALRQGNAGLVIAFSLALIEHGADRGAIRALQRFPRLRQPLLILDAFGRGQPLQKRPAVEFKRTTQGRAPPGAGRRRAQGAKLSRIGPCQGRIQADVVIGQLQQVGMRQGAAQMGEEMSQFAPRHGLALVGPKEKEQFLTRHRLQMSGQA